MQSKLLGLALFVGISAAGNSTRFDFPIETDGEALAAIFPTQDSGLGEPDLFGPDKATRGVDLALSSVDDDVFVFPFQYQRSFFDSRPEASSAPSPFISVLATPEPRSWAMIVLGFGFFGWVLRRTRERAALG